MKPNQIELDEDHGERTSHAAMREWQRPVLMKLRGQDADLNPGAGPDAESTLS